MAQATMVLQERTSPTRATVLLIADRPRASGMTTRRNRPVGQHTQSSHSERPQRQEGLQRFLLIDCGFDNYTHINSRRRTTPAHGLQAHLHPFKLRPRNQLVPGAQQRAVGGGRFCPSLIPWPKLKGILLPHGPHRKLRISTGDMKGKIRPTEELDFTP